MLAQRPYTIKDAQIADRLNRFSVHHYYSGTFKTKLTKLWKNI